MDGMIILKRYQTFGKKKKKNLKIQLELQTQEGSFSRMGDLVDAMKSLATMFGCCHFVSGQKYCNCAAHLLALEAKNLKFLYYLEG